MKSNSRTRSEPRLAGNFFIFFLFFYNFTKFCFIGKKNFKELDDEEKPLSALKKNNKKKRNNVVSSSARKPRKSLKSSINPGNFQFHDFFLNFSISRKNIIFFQKIMNNQILIWMLPKLQDFQIHLLHFCKVKVEHQWCSRLIAGNFQFHEFFPQYFNLTKKKLFTISRIFFSIFQFHEFFFNFSTSRKTICLRFHEFFFQFFNFTKFFFIV